MGIGACGCCGKEFELPIKLTVLSEGPQETYFACPFCFSKVKATMAEPTIRPVVDKKPDKVREKGKTETVRAGASGCGHHLGYLKERTKNAAIPDECLVCPKILECMT